MPRRAAERVTQALLDQIGTGLRTVVIVTPDDFEPYYLSETLRDQYSKGTYANVVDAFRLETPMFSPEIDDFPIGERRAIVHYHENAFVIQFPFSETETILISVQPEVGRELLRFIEQCRELVRDDDPDLR